MERFYHFEVSFGLTRHGDATGSLICSKLAALSQSAMASSLFGSSSTQLAHYFLIAAWPAKPAQLPQHLGALELVLVDAQTAVDTPWGAELLNQLAQQRLPAHLAYLQSVVPETPSSPPSCTIPLLLLEYDNDPAGYDELLYRLWRDFQVDSLISDQTYREAISFGVRAGQAIACLIDYYKLSAEQVLASFHQWNSGAGLFYLRKQQPAVSSQLVLHSTALGLALAQQQRDLYSLGKGEDIDALAHTYGVFARHSLEKKLVRAADALNSIGRVVAQEANVLLGRFPDKILAVGCDGRSPGLTWEQLYPAYQASYQLAFKLHQLSQLALQLQAGAAEQITTLSNELSAVPRLYELHYESAIPKPLQGLQRLAQNLWWSWQPAAQQLFSLLDETLWQQSQHNPIVLLNTLSSKQWQQALVNTGLIELYQRVMQQFDAYMLGTSDLSSTSLSHTPTPSPASPLIAYFCMEYALDDHLSGYSGGLGVLAADYLKSFSDLQADGQTKSPVAVVAVGLLYRRGYFVQQLNNQGGQEEDYPPLQLNQLPLSLVRDQSGNHLLTSVEIAGRTIYAQVWQLAVGRVQLYLLDTDVVENLTADRTISSNLYVDDKAIRLLQELVLGIGGVRLLQEKLGLAPTLYYLNEAHAGFMFLERLRLLTAVNAHTNNDINNANQQQTYPLEEAILLIRSSTKFTTHTPVASGDEQFSRQLISDYLGSFVELRLKKLISMEQLLAWGSKRSDHPDSFSLTALALRFSLQINTVSEAHNRTSQALWHSLWGSWLECEVPLTHINNGLHLASWLGPEMRALYDELLPPGWAQQEHCDWAQWQQLLSCPCERLVQAHGQQKQRLINAVRQRITKEYLAREASPRLLRQSLQALQAANGTSLQPPSLLIGISRRFTRYKRNNLFMRQLQRLGRLLTNPQRPVVILMAGKAHPSDQVGKQMLQQALIQIGDPQLAGRVIFLQNYDLTLAKLMVQGVDLWLNTPIAGSEACGTSGMKVAINGGLNLSTCDGWWETEQKRRQEQGQSWGWTLDSYPEITDEEKRAKLENNSLLQLLEDQIVPLFYQSPSSDLNKERTDAQNVPQQVMSTAWLERMRHSLTGVSYFYSARRMVVAYLESYKQLASYQRKLLTVNGASALLARVASWQQSLESRFNRVSVKAVVVQGAQHGRLLASAGGRLQVQVLLYPGKMTAGELVVELVLLGESVDSLPIIVPLHRVDSARGDSGVGSGNAGETDEEFYTYLAEYQLQDSGFYRYGVRIRPTAAFLFRAQEVALVRWS